MTYYNYKEIYWMGPNIYNIHPDIKKCQNAPNISAKFVEMRENRKWVLYSEYLCQQGDELIIGPPDTFTNCFQKIMDYISDEISAAKLNDNSYGTVSACLQSHKIIVYYDMGF